MAKGKRDKPGNKTEKVRPAWSAWLVLLGLCLLGATAWSDPAMQSYSDPEESYSISYFLPHQDYLSGRWQ
jgi:hypothetical protein